MKTLRPRGKPFTPGNQYGKGRPVGSRNKVTVALEQLLEGEAEAIMRKMAELAKEGDPTALRLSVDRLCPLRRERPLRMTLPEIRAAADLPAAFRVIMRELARGNLTTAEVESISRSLESGRKVFEMQELAQRLEAVEKALKEVLASHEHRAA